MHGTLLPQQLQLLEILFGRMGSTATQSWDYSLSPGG